MGTALKGLQASMGPLLAVTAAIAGVVAAVSFFKDSIGDAAKLQESFAVLGATVTAQGGNWATAKDGVDKFAESLEKTTTYSRGEVIPALTDLTRRGIDLHDSQLIVATATDAAAASGKPLLQVVDQLASSEFGRKQVLAELGINITSVAAKSMTMQQVLDLVRAKTGGAAAADLNTYAGRMKQFGNVMESLHEDVGSVLLPALTEIVTGLTKVVEGFDRAFNAISASLTVFAAKYHDQLAGIQKIFAAVFAAIEVVVRVAFDATAAIVTAGLAILGDALKLFGDVFSGNWGNIWKDVQTIFADGGTALKDTFGNAAQDLLTIAQRLGTDIKTALGDVFGAVGKALHGDFAGAASQLGAAGGSFAGLTAGLAPILGGDAASHLFGGGEAAKTADELGKGQLDKNVSVGRQCPALYKAAHHKG
ncbi:MAG: hypothetical protein ACREM8_13315, partial [Vulcanimicrobiaceae bacterium]